jgi:hypothetical protein
MTFEDAAKLGYNKASMNEDGTFSLAAKPLPPPSFATAQTGALGQPASADEAKNKKEAFD